MSNYKIGQKLTQDEAGVIEDVSSKVSGTNYYVVDEVFFSKNPDGTMNVHRIEDMPDEVADFVFNKLQQSLRTDIILDFGNDKPLAQA